MRFNKYIALLVFIVIITSLMAFYWKSTKEQFSVTYCNTEVYPTNGTGCPKPYAPKSSDTVKYNAKSFSINPNWSVKAYADKNCKGESLDFTNKTSNPMTVNFGQLKDAAKQKKTKFQQDFTANGIQCLYVQNPNSAASA